MATRRRVARTYVIEDWEVRAYWGGVISPIAQAEHDPGTDNPPPRPRGQDSPIRDKPGRGEGPQEGQAHREPRTGGEGGSAIRHTPPQMQPKTWGLERGAREESPTRGPTPRPGKDRKRTPGHADGAGSRQRRRKEQPAKQEKSGTKWRLKSRVWSLLR